MHSSSDAGDFGMPKRNQTVVPSCENVEVLYLIKEEKIICEVAQIYGKTEPFVYEIMKKEKEICATFTMVRQTANVTATSDILSCHIIIRGRMSTIRYFKTVREPHIHQLLLQYTITIFLCHYCFC